MSTTVTAFIPPSDPTYLKHKKVLEACLEADIQELPKETATYFGSEYPDKSMLEEKLKINLKKHAWSDESSEGYEIYIKDIPEGVEKIQFYNSW